MSSRALTWAVRQQAGGPGPKAVLLALANRADADGWCYAGMGVLESDTEIPDRSIRRHLAALESRGLVSKLRRHRRDGSRAVNGYQLNILEGVQAANVAGSQAANVAGSQAAIVTGSQAAIVTGSQAATMAPSPAATMAGRQSQAATMAGRIEPSGQNGGGQPATMTALTSFEPTDEPSLVEEEALTTISAHTRESGPGSSSNGQQKTKAEPVPEPDDDDDARIAAVDEMGVEVDKHAATISDFLARKRFIASTRQVVSGDDRRVWQDQNGDQVPWSDRPRLFRLALDKLEAGERPDLRRALILAIQQQYDPFQRRKSNTPPPGSEAAAVAARGVETPRSNTPRRSSGPARMGNVPVDLDADRARISAWERKNPAECRELKAKAEALVAEDPKTADLKGAIRNVAVDGRYRMLLRELLAEAEKPVASG